MRFVGPLSPGLPFNSSASARIASSKRTVVVVAMPRKVTERLGTAGKL